MESKEGSKGQWVDKRSEGVTDRKKRSGRKRRRKRCEEETQGAKQRERRMIEGVGGKGRGRRERQRKGNDTKSQRDQTQTGSRTCRNSTICSSSRCAIDGKRTGLHTVAVVMSETKETVGAYGE